jgi:hypothetical protein
VDSREKLHNEELHNFTLHQILLADKLKRMRWAGHVADMEEMTNAYKVLVVKPHGKRSFEE